MSLSELDVPELEPEPEDRDDEESVSDSESPLESDSTSGTALGASGAADELGATVVSKDTSGVRPRRRRRLVREYPQILRRRLSRGSLGLGDLGFRNSGLDL